MADQIDDFVFVSHGEDYSDGSWVRFSELPGYAFPTAFTTPGDGDETDANRQYPVYAIEE